MSDFIDIKPSESAVRFLREKPASVILPLIARAMDRENELTVGAIVERRMSFPKGGAITREGLRVGSGQARRSINRAPAQIQGTAVVSSIGSNVRHVGVHEFGYQGKQNVRSHTRVVRSIDGKGRVIAGRDFGFGSRNVAGPFSRQIAGRGSRARMAQTGVAFVKAHTRNANFPARAMIRRTIEERRANYVAAIEAVAKEGLGS